MGLDLTHNCWSGSYPAFNRWRDKLGEVAGYTFHKSPDGFGYSPDIDWGNIENIIGHDLDGKWPNIPVRPDGTPDPLIILMAHSDCGGYLQTEYLDALANRLEDLLPKLENLDDGGHIGSYTDKTQTFIKGLRLAAKCGERVGFH